MVGLMFVAEVGWCHETPYARAIRDVLDTDNSVRYVGRNIHVSDFLF